MRSSILYRVVAFLLVVLVTSTPPLCDVALAQEAPNQPMRTQVAVAQISLVSNDVLQATVTSGARSVNVEIRKSGLTFGEGYALRLQRVDPPTVEAVPCGDTLPYADGTDCLDGSDGASNNDVIEMIAEAPDGRTTVATLRFDRETGTGTSEGLAQVHDLLAESGTLDLVEAGMPIISAAAVEIADGAAGARSVTGSPLRPSADSLKLTTNGWWGCLGAVIAAYGAALLVIGACGIPEPVEPIVCAGSIIVLIGCLLTMAEACELL